MVTITINKYGNGSNTGIISRIGNIKNTPTEQRNRLWPLILMIEGKIANYY